MGAPKKTSTRDECGPPNPEVSAGKTTSLFLQEPSRCPSMKEMAVPKNPLHGLNSVKYCAVNLETQSAEALHLKTQNSILKDSKAKTNASKYMLTVPSFNMLMTYTCLSLSLHIYIHITYIHIYIYGTPPKKTYLLHASIRSPPKPTFLHVPIRFVFASTINMRIYFYI